ncbi:O-antigen ligase family protein [Arthrobacter sp. ZGTC412]|uniref:O-antigen ligase family protein n=1 Tax=Arthrobacter sp. ZGTC412 TaxID=2058900 RepID=UPI0015E3A48C|nr:O-antigen ligase family protein [Arthrobacter sp. ZGTC412]
MSLLPDVCVAVILAVVIFSRRRKGGTKTLAWGVAWLFIGWVAVASVPSIAAMPEQAVYGLRAMLWGLVIAMTMQTMDLSEWSRNFIRRVLLFVLLANMLLALFQAVVGLSAVELQGLMEAGASYQVESQTRLLGFQATGQELSMLAGSAFVWSCATMVSRGFRLAGPLIWFLCLTSAVVTLVVLQRSALIGALVAMAILVFSINSGSLRGRRAAATRRFGAVAGASMLSIVALAVLAPERVDLALARFQSLFGLSSDYSFNVRQDTTLPVALKLIAEQPLGYGLGASGPVAAKFVPSGPLADYPLGGIAADNGYLFVALQIGVPGLVLFFLLLVTWGFSGTFFDTVPHERLAPRSVICFLAAIMVSGSFWGLTGSMALVVALASIGGGAATNRGALNNGPAPAPDLLRSAANPNFVHLAQKHRRPSSSD